jgi:hypothetical protein
MKSTALFAVVQLLVVGLVRRAMLEFVWRQVRQNGDR